MTDLPVWRRRLPYLCCLHVRCEVKKAQCGLVSMWRWLPVLLRIDWVDSLHEVAFYLHFHHRCSNLQYAGLIPVSKTKPSRCNLPRVHIVEGPQHAGQESQSHKYNHDTHDLMAYSRYVGLCVETIVWRTWSRMQEHQSVPTIRWPGLSDVVVKPTVAVDTSDSTEEQYWCL